MLGYKTPSRMVPGLYKKKEEGWERGQNKILKRTSCNRNANKRLKRNSALGEDGPSAGGCLTPSSEGQIHVEATRPMTIISTMTAISIGRGS